jgi:hypothetical protein
MGSSDSFVAAGGPPIARVRAFNRAEVPAVLTRTKNRTATPLAAMDSKSVIVNPDDFIS